MRSRCDSWMRWMRARASGFNGMTLSRGDASGPATAPHTIGECASMTSASIASARSARLSSSCRSERRLICGRLRPTSIALENAVASISRRRWRASTSGGTSPKRTTTSERSPSGATRTLLAGATVPRASARTSSVSISRATSSRKRASASSSLTVRKPPSRADATVAAARARRRVSRGAGAPSSR